ncbi:MAG TPA: DarT ssDNA thymidine ADP-ribosyltransferase family protein [Devosiaceae bacterium]
MSIGTDGHALAVYLSLSAWPVENPLRYEKTRYADIIERIGEAALERVVVSVIGLINGEWRTLREPVRFVSGEFGYDCRNDPDFGYAHASNGFMADLVCKAADLEPGAYLMEPMKTEVYERPNSSEDIEAINEQIAIRRIRQLVHFTAVENLQSIREHGILSVKRMAEMGILDHAVRNDFFRGDRRPDGISLSISRTNKALLHSYWRPDRHPDREYVALSVDPSVINNRMSIFFDSNAALSQNARREPRDAADGEAFARMFGNDPRQPLDLTDSEQAEVMVFGDIPPHLIKGVVFESEPALKRHRHLLGEMKARVSRRYFR